MAVAADRYTIGVLRAPRQQAMPSRSPRANAAAQWWRNGHSHLDERDLDRSGTSDGRASGPLL
jgi:hypothetical protein